MADDESEDMPPTKRAKRSAGQAWEDSNHTYTSNGNEDQPKPKKLLLINPNSSISMTLSLEKLANDLGISPLIEIVPYTAPSTAPSSINNGTDGSTSADIVIEDIKTSLSEYDAFLVACYSVHPLVSLLQERIDSNVHVTGIFEASISAALALLPQRDGRRMKQENVHRFGQFGILSTGKYWEKALSDGVMEYIGTPGEACRRFKGVETTGLTAEELHTTSPEVVNTKMKEAAKRLVVGGECSVICLGCAGMAGMDEIVREAVVEELGEEEAKFVRIVDGVKAGIVFLEGMMRTLPDRRRL